jgi:hypothetical protein
MESYEDLEKLLAEDLTFDELIRIIEGCSVIVRDVKKLREKAMAMADAACPVANRSIIGRAAMMSPSSTQRVLARNGRPASRRAPQS